MRKKIFIVIAIILAGVFAKFGSLSATNPQEFSQKLNGNLFLASRALSDINFFTKKEYKAPTQEIGNSPRMIVRTVEAKEEKIVLYKGKRISVKVFDKGDEVPLKVLEFLYQLELQKEKK